MISMSMMFEMVDKVVLESVEGLIKLAKRHKLKSLSAFNIQFEFREPNKRASRVVTPKTAPLLLDGMPSDDEMLYHSADSPIQVPK